MPKIELDPLTHIYRRDGIVVPNSVTGLIKKAGYIDDRWLHEHGRVRGKLTHKAIEYHNRGTLDEDALDPQLQPFFWAYVSFLTDSGFVVTESELSVYNEEYDYAGTIDIVGSFKANPGILYIGDTKTCPLPKWGGIQTKLYAMALDGYYRRFGLQLKKNGTYRYREYGDWSDLREAIKILEEDKRERSKTKQ